MHTILLSTTTSFKMGLPDAYIDQPVWANLNDTGQMGLRYQLCLPDADEYFLIKSAAREGRYQLLFVRVLSTEAHQSLWSVSPRQRAIQRNNSAHRLIE